MNFKNEIINYCSSLGLNLVGFTRCRIFHELKEFYYNRKSSGFENEFEEKDIEKRINPYIYMKEGKTIISIAFPYITEKTESSKIYFSKYTLGNDYHRVVSKYLENICCYIRTLGGEAKYFVDSNSLPERYLAYLSGVGFIGKNNMLITKEYGSYVFLGEIITDLELESDKPIEVLCSECNKCIEACPTKAISERVTNSNICLSYITQKKDIEDYWFNKFEGRIFGCDTCQDVCPYNYKVKLSNLEEFTPYDFMKNIDSEEIFNMSNREFKDRYKLTSCGWRGKNVIQRNLLINMFNLESIKKELEFYSTYLQEYYNRLLKISEK